MILRVRSRDGLERVSLPGDANTSAVADLAREAQEQLRLPPDQPLLFSRHQKLLLAKEEASARLSSEFLDPQASLGSLGLNHGDVVYLWYPLERHVEGPKVPVFAAGSFGKKMTVEDMVARQIRIERQEQPHCQLLSFDRNAANQFQLYVSDTLGFSVQRGGFMYGTCDEEGQVQVDFIYEPPQTGTDSTLLLHRNQAEERCVEAIAAGLGMRRVGFVFTRSAAQSGEEEQDYTLSHAELRLAAQLHAEALGLRVRSGAPGEDPAPDTAAAGAAGAAAGAVAPNGAMSASVADDLKGVAGFKQFSVGLVKLEANEEGGSDVHFEAFQLSDQCVKLFAEGLFAEPGEVVAGADARKKKQEEGSKEGREEMEKAGVTRMRKEVIVTRKDTFEVDNDFFLVAVKIADHEGPLQCSFPVENRIVAATDKDLRAYLEKTRNVKPFGKRLADFHLLLYLSHIFDPTADLPTIAEAVRLGTLVPEGYQLIIESF